MTVPCDEIRTSTSRSPRAELARRILAGRNLTVEPKTTAPQQFDELSSLRYRSNIEHDRLREEVVAADSNNTTTAESEMATKKQVDLGDQLRKAIRRSGLTRNQIAKRADLSYAIVHGLMAETSDLRLSTASKIAAIVGVELRPPDAARRR